MSKLERIFSLLDKFRLESFYNAFLEIGVKDERDFIDSIDDEVLTTLGLSHVEKKRFANMQSQIGRLGSMIEKSMEAFRVTYTFPKCSEPKEISNIDPSQNTLDDLMLRIGHQEQIGNDKAVCLYTMDGMPLTDDPFFNTWCLNERHIENGSELYAIFTPKENILTPVKCHPQLNQTHGVDSVRCHVMLKGDYEVKVNLDTDKLKDLRNKLSHETGIPAHVLHAKDVEGSNGAHLKDLGQSVVHFSLSSLDEKYQEKADFFHSDIAASVEQTQKGLSVFFSTLYAIHMQHSDEQFLKVIAYIRKLTGCNALALALYQIMCKGEFGTRNQKIAVVEGLYLLFRELLPSLTKRNGLRVIEDYEVFEYSTICWAYLISQAKNDSSHSEIYATIRLTCEGSGSYLCEPVRIPGMASVFERAFIQDKIRGEQRIPNCTEERLRETSIQRAKSVEKILMSLPRQTQYFHQWIAYDCGYGCNFQVEPEKTYEEMAEGLSVYSHLELTPPLQLKTLGTEGPRLVLIKEDNCAVYLRRNKSTPQLQSNQQPTHEVHVFNCLTGKNMNVDVDELAKQLKDARTNQTYKTSGVPKEAILGYVNSLQASGSTPLYDALHQGISKLRDVKKKFPDCRLRMLCLTDGQDEGSMSDPVQVAVKLIDANIVVDSVLLGEEKNTVLHGISNVTGGCCFKPETGKDALKLFEMETVLSLEGRKLKKIYDASSILTMDDLSGILQRKGYDKEPEVILPKEINDKVTLTQIALAKPWKTRKLLNRDRRILDELKCLHIDPHPYCTVLPSETDFSFWKILMAGPPDTPYEEGTFELYCQFGTDYPLKPPLVRFITPIHHCNVNSVGRICHNIFDRNYSANVTMKDILDAVFGLLIAPEPDDPLDSVLAEEYRANPQAYAIQAKKNTAEAAGTSLEVIEQKLVGEDLCKVHIPPHLVCRLSKKMFVDPVETCYGDMYERKHIEKALKRQRVDPFSKKLLRRTDLKPNKAMKDMVKEHRRRAIPQPISI